MSSPAPLLGCEEPRIWTPPLRELTPETSDGFACIYFAENVLKMRLMPWQKWLLIHALELNADGTYRFRTVLLLVARQNGKALDVETPILTVDGWSTMGQLQVGDSVFHPDGRPTEVVGAFDVMHDRRCYRVTTTDGRSLVADADHLWTVQDRRRVTKKGRRGEPARRTYAWETLTTEQLLARGLMRSVRECAYRLPRQRMLATEPVDLPIDPYILGLWLGDGGQRQAIIHVGDQDVEETAANIESAGARIVSVIRQRTCWGVTFNTGRVGDGFEARSRKLGTWGNKHIPPHYLTAGTDQRLALLQGLLDSDGYISKAGQVEFCSINEQLANDVLYLVRSLGWRSTVRSARATLNGQDHGPKYRVMFTPDRSEPCPFRLARKAQRIRNCQSRGGERHAVSIRSIEEVPSRPVRCIKVACEDGLFLAGRDLVATHNTVILQILALWHIYAKGSPTVIGTAQDLKNSVKTWQETVALAQANPELALEISNVVQQRGDNALILHSGEQYKVAVAGRRGARGFSGDLILLDELREHQTWDAWAAATKTTLARPRAQVWAFSNAGDFLAVVLRYLRAVAHQSLGWPDGDDDKASLSALTEDDEIDDADGDTLGIFEWSMDPLLPRRDRAGWAQANPSMNHTEVTADVITERAIASARRTDPPQIFDCEVLCRWPKIGEGGPFPVGRWSATQVGSAEFTGDRIVLAVDVSWDRSRAYIARAGFDADGVVLDIAFADRGTDGVVPWLVEHRDRYSLVTLQGTGAPVSSLLDDMEAAGLPVVPCTAGDLGKAWGVTWDLVDEPEPGREHTTFKHLPHPGLDLAASTAVLRKLGDVVVIDRKDSPHDAAPLVAATEVLWLLGKPPQEPKVPTVHDAPTEEEIAQWEQEDLL